MSEFVETYRNCDIHRDGTFTNTGAGVQTTYRYFTNATKAGGNKSSLRASELNELKRKIDQFIDAA